MRIMGEWQVGDDGTTRPVVAAQVQCADGALLAEDFLVDSGADRTVFRAHPLQTLDFPVNAGSEGSILQGIGGVGESVVVNTVVVLTRDDRGEVHMRGEFAAFTDPSATDMSILGRDILNKFDVILSHQRDEVLLLAMNHRYRVEQVRPEWRQDSP
jgi:Retroviral aspartyl protease